MLMIVLFMNNAEVYRAEVQNDPQNEQQRNTNPQDMRRVVNNQFLRIRPSTKGLKCIFKSE
jgi:hypothetical protein